MCFQTIHKHFDVHILNFLNSLYFYCISTLLQTFSAGGQGVGYFNIPKGEPAPELNHVRIAGITIDPYNKQNVALDEWVIGWTGPGEWMRYQVKLAL
jgi:hypothetical protein